jgi:hypothetical protein
MSKNKSDEKIWLKKNIHSLIESGIPQEIVESQKKWNYVLLHGDDELGGGWNTEWISDNQAKALLDLLCQFYKNQIGLDLINILERRVNNAKNGKAEDVS